MHLTLEICSRFNFSYVVAGLLFNMIIIYFALLHPNNLLCRISTVFPIRTCLLLVSVDCALVVVRKLVLTSLGKYLSRTLMIKQFCYTCVRH